MVVKYSKVTGRMIKENTEDKFPILLLASKEIEANVKGTKSK